MTNELNLPDWATWPHISADLLARIKQWAIFDKPFAYKAGVTNGEQALAQLAQANGRQELIDKLTAVHKRQMESVEKSNTPSHVRK